MENIKLFLAVSVCIGPTYGSLPSALSVTEKCDRFKPGLEKCLVEIAESYRSVLAKGVAELEFPSLDPFSMYSIPFEHVLPGLKIKGVATNIVAYGGRDFQIKKLQINGNRAVATVVIPRLEITADYDTEGSKMLLINVGSKGKFTGVLNDVTAVVSMRGRIDTEDDGLEYLKLSFSSAKITFGRGCNINAKTNTKSIAARVAVQILNSTPAYKILTLLAPIINNAAGPIIKKTANKILKNLPLNELLLN